MAYQNHTSRYFASLDNQRKSTRLPGTAYYQSDGRAYLEPEIPQFERLMRLKTRIARWTRIAFWTRG